MTKRWLRGLAAGWVVYMTVVVITAYDGLPSIILQPIIAAVLAGAMSLITVLVGWPLHATRLKETWEKLGRWTLLPAAVGLAILLFGKQLGLTHTIAAKEPGERDFEALPGRLPELAFFLCVFPAANLPKRRG